MSIQDKLDRSIYAAKITIDDQAYTYRDLFEIDDTSIADEFMTQSARFAYLAAKAGAAEALYEEAKSDLETLYADIDREVRIDYKHDKLTEPKIKQLILSDDDYVDQVHKVNRRLHDWRVLKALADAMRQRGELLRSIGAWQRTEYEITDMKVKQKLRDVRGNR